MVSIIILTHNNLKYTKLCIESIHKSTDPKKTPYEIIVVDNGSTDGTPQVLETMLKLKKVQDVGLHPTNVGFPQGNNIGASRAKGELICLLNNDVVVSAGWLEKLVRVMNSDPNIAAVGPYTSHSAGHQQVSQVMPYKDQESLNELARNAELETKEVDFLVFFCVVIKRHVWDKIGGLDEDFGMGNYEDNYFCHRAIQKGYKLKAVDCYVHHFGSKTFKSPRQGPQFNALLARNQKIFLKKIGAYKTIALCMIVGDHEKPAVLRRCLQSLAPWVDEVNIVFNYKRWPMTSFKFGKDAIYSSKYPKKFLPIGKWLDEKKIKHDFKYLKWTNFSDMRNKSLGMTWYDYGTTPSTDYILWADTDDVLATPQGLRDMIYHHPGADVLKCRVNSLTPTRSVDMIFQNRLFKNNPKYRFRNLVHEDVSFSQLEAGAKIITTQITFTHLGNTDRTPAEIKKRNKRNYDFLIKEIDKPEAHSLTYYNMVNCLMQRAGKGDAVRAIQYINEAFKKFQLKEEDALYAKMYVLKGLCCMHEGQALAAKQAFHHVYAKDKNPEAAINLAEIYKREARWDKVIEILEGMFAREKDKGIKVKNMPVDLEEVEFLAHWKLGDAYAHKEDYSKAEKHYVNALLINDRELVIADRLVQILLRQGDESKAMYMSMKYVNLFPTYYVGWLNMGQYELRSKRLITAKLFFDTALLHKPDYKEALVNVRSINMILEGRRKK